MERLLFTFTGPVSAAGQRREGRQARRGARTALRCAIAVATLVLLVGTGPSPARAQAVTVTPNDTRPTGGWTLTPVFVFSQSSDSNVTLANQGTANTGDSVATLSPSAELGYLSPLMSFTAGYSGSIQRYFTLDQLDTFDQRLYADFKRDVTRHVRVFAQNSANWMPTTDSVLLAGVPFVRIGSRIESLQGGATVALSRYTSATIGYRFDRVDFDRSSPLAAQLFGGHSNGAFGSLSRQVAAHLSVGAAFDIRRAVVGGGLQQFDLQNVEGTIEYRVSEALVVSGGAGVARVITVLPGNLSRTGPSWHAGTNYRLGRTVAYASYSRSYVPTFAIGGTVQDEEFDAGASRPIAFRRRLVATGSYTWRRNDPLTTSLLPLTQSWISGSTAYSFTPWLRIEGFYSRSTQDTRLGNVDRTVFGASVVALAPVRFR